MTLGAQLFSLRTMIRDEAGLRSTVEKMRDIGYTTFQLSGAGPIPADRVAAISRDAGMPVVLTHMPYDRILHDTDALIREHEIMQCPVIGLGSMPQDARKSAKDLFAFLDAMREAVGKIRAAGLSFAYHNHNFEFAPLPDSDKVAYDLMLDACPDWKFIPDTYWISFAGCSPVEYLYQIGAERLAPVHFKDMAKNEARSICACGDGVLDFRAITDACRDLGVEHILVEQDNAPDAPDPIDEMRRSFVHLAPIIGEA